MKQRRRIYYNAEQRNCGVARLGSAEQTPHGACGMVYCTSGKKTANLG